MLWSNSGVDDAVADVLAVLLPVVEVEPAVVWVGVVAAVLDGNVDEEEVLPPPPFWSGDEFPTWLECLALLLPTTPPTTAPMITRIAATTRHQNTSAGKPHILFLRDGFSVGAAYWPLGYGAPWAKSPCWS